MYNEASKRATNKYKSSNIRRIPLEMKISYYETIKQAADAAGEPVNAYIKEAIRRRLEQDKEWEGK